MKYLLDTNTCIRYLNGRSQPVFQKINSLSTDDIVVCSIVKAELFFGAMKSQNPAKTLEGQEAFLANFVSLPFDDKAAPYYAQIRAKLSVAGTPIGSNDYFIAAIALAYNLILVTHNIAEFSRVEGLQLEDWESL